MSRTLISSAAQYGGYHAVYLLNPRAAEPEIILRAWVVVWTPTATGTRSRHRCTQHVLRRRPHPPPKGPLRQTPSVENK